MSKATKILNTVNKGFEKVGLTYPTYNWSKDLAVDQEMVNEIHKMDEFIPIENEKFLYTSLCVRRYGLCATRSNLLVTDKRIIFWNTYWQVNYRSSLLPIISSLDIDSLHSLKKDQTLDFGMDIFFVYSRQLYYRKYSRLFFLKSIKKRKYSINEESR